MIRRAWQRWRQLGEIIGGVNARILLTLFYFTLAIPFGLLYRILADPLEIKRRRSSGWTKRGERRATLQDARNQF